MYEGFCALNAYAKGSRAKMKRVTLQRPIEVKGLGLHKGKETKVLMLPSEEESGIMIGTSKEGRRYPIGECELFSPGRASCILLPDGQMIYTMEHLLSAFYGMEVDDAVILVVGGRSRFSMAVLNLGFEA